VSDVSAANDSKVDDLGRRLLEMIEELPVGSRLPAERELADRWSVARMTLRRAVDRLIIEGRVERRAGSGTYVTRPPYAKLLGLTSFTQDMLARGLVPSSRLLELRRLRATTAVAHRLRIPEGDEVVRFTRLRLATGEPMAVETVWIPAAFVPGLAAEDLVESLYDLLRDRYNIRTSAAQATVHPVLPDARIAGSLGLETAQPCLRFEMTDLDHKGRVVMAADCVYRGDRYWLRVDLGAPAFQRRQAA
jgi:GntR family transcriptional regulator